MFLSGIDLPGFMGEGDSQVKTYGEVDFFDASAISGNPATLDFHLSLALTEIKTTSTLKQASKAPLVQKLGTAIFDFTLPFHPGKTITSGQQVTSHGKTGTLKKVVITPSAIRIFLHIDGLKPPVPPKKSLYFPAIADLQVPGQAPLDYRSFGPATAIGDLDPGDLMALYDSNFADKAGTWTLTVKGDTDTWIFHFEVPA